jgi:hypothetical protein
MSFSLSMIMRVVLNLAKLDNGLEMSRPASQG